MSHQGAFNLNAVLEKMGRSDKDFRFMAASDLLAELKKENFKIEPAQEKKLGDALLKLLIHDLSGDVQTQAQLCLGPFVKKVSTTEIGILIEQLLFSLLESEKDTQRDSSSYGLKTVIQKMPAKSSTLLMNKLVPSLMNTLTNTAANPDIKVECLEILNAVITRFPSLFSPPSVYNPLKDAVFQELSSKRKNNRKKATLCLASLSASMEAQDFNNLIKDLVRAAETSKSHDTIRSSIQTLGSISGSSGYRLADSMGLVVPIVIACVQGRHKNLSSAELEEDDELRENCFQTLESLVVRCPGSITPHLEPIIRLCLEFIKYDPNYNEDAMVDDADAEEGFEDFDEWEEEIDYSDDEDVSWKVRKAASKTLGEVISTHSEILPSLCSSVAPVLISRFKEREETVKLDIFKTFNRLLKQIQATPSSRKSGALQTIESLVESIVVSLSNILADTKEVKMKVRIGIFTLLKELVQCSSISLGPYLHLLIKGIQAALTDKNATSNLKIEALTFLRLLFSKKETLESGSINPETLVILSESVFQCVSDNYYKITAEALRVCTAIIPILTAAEGAQYDAVTLQLYQVLFPKLTAQDIDQEVKEAAINCAALLVTRAGNKLPPSALQQCLEIFLDRLNNEITRFTTVKALSLVAESPLKINLGPILVPAVTLLTGFLRLNNRQLKQSVLGCLCVLFSSQQTSALSDSLRDLFENLVPLVNDEDLPLTHLALRLATEVVVAHSGAAKIIKEKIFPCITELLESKVLQGLALDSLLELLREIVRTRTKGFGFKHISKVITGILNKSSLAKQSYPAGAQCMGVLCATTTEKHRNVTIENYLEQLRKPGEDSQKYVTLLCIGEVGRRVNLSNHTGLEILLSNIFDENVSEEFKSTAAGALGNVAVGNLQKYLPFILEDLASHPDRQYFLLLALREVISRQSKTPNGVRELFSHLQTQQLDLLLGYCQAPKVGVRNVVSECLGRLVLVRPSEMLERLSFKLQSTGSPFDRSTAVTALKFAVIDSDAGSVELDQLLESKICLFLNPLSDSDVDVRKSALLTFNYLVHNRPGLVIEYLPQYLGAVYEETNEKPDLLRKVKVGPFTYVADEGLDNRKAAFECLYTLMETCLSHLDLPVFISHLVRGLQDNSADIKSMCHIILEHLAKSAGSALSYALESVIEPLRATLVSKPKENAVKQDKDRYEELVRSALRAILAITKIPNVDNCTRFNDFMTTVVTAGEIGEKFTALQQSQAEEGMDTSN